jgi:hypothetical protein
VESLILLDAGSSKLVLKSSIKGSFKVSLKWTRFIARLLLFFDEFSLMKDGSNTTSCANKLEAKALVKNTKTHRNLMVKF